MACGPDEDRLMDCARCLEEDGLPHDQDTISTSLTDPFADHQAMCDLSDDQDQEVQDDSLRDYLPDSFLMEEDLGCEDDVDDSDDLDERLSVMKWSVVHDYLSRVVHQTLPKGCKDTAKKAKAGLVKVAMKVKQGGRKLKRRQKTDSKADERSSVDAERDSMETDDSFFARL